MSWHKCTQSRQSIHLRQSQPINYNNKWRKWIRINARGSYCLTLKSSPDPSSYLFPSANDYVDDENDGVDEDPVFAREDNVSFVDTDEESVATVVSGESGDEED